MQRCSSKIQNLYFDDTNPVHWLARIHLHAPKLLVTDEFGPEFCSLPKENQRNYDSLTDPKIQHDVALPNVMISYMQTEVRTPHTIPMVLNINHAKM